MIMQSFISPLVSYKKDENGKAVLGQLFGTVFFINKDGIFLTAKHVVDSALEAAQENGSQIGIVVKGQGEKSTESFIAELDTYEYYGDKVDVAIGKINYQIPPELKFTNAKVADIYSDVITFGYPLDAIYESVFYEARALKGYIQREIYANRDNAFVDSGCDTYELNFVVSRGMSGSPLIKVDEKGNFIVVGICIGYNRSETIDFERTEVNDSGEVFTESVRKIVEYSRAPAIYPFLNWKPSMLEGYSVYDVSTHLEP